MAEPQRILLTGATGYVGAACVRAFAAAGKIDKVVCVVRNGDRAQEVVEFGATKLRLVPNIVDVPSTCLASGEFDCFLNLVNPGGGYKYAHENQVATEAIEAMRARPQGGAVVQCSGSGCVGGILKNGQPTTACNGIAKDGQRPGEFTDWADFVAYNPRRHGMERTIVHADGLEGGKLRTALVRPPGIYGADGRSDVCVRPFFESAEQNGAADVAGDGSQILPLVHVDDLADLLVRVCLNPAAHGVFHVSEALWTERSSRALNALQLGRLCSEAAGCGGRVKLQGRGVLDLDQLLGCANSLSLGWKPRIFDAKREWENYLKGKEGWQRRQATNKDESIVFSAKAPVNAHLQAKI